MQSNLQRLERNGAELLMGEEYTAYKNLRAHLESERWFRKKELLEFEEDLLKGDEMEKTLQLAVELLDRRKCIRISKDRISINRKKRSYLEYYANTIRHYLQAEEAVLAP